MQNRGQFLHLSKLLSIHF